MKKLAPALLAFAACTASENIGNTSPGLDDLDAAVYPRVPVFGAERWRITLGGAQPDRVTSIAVAADGDLIVAGSFQSTVNFGFGDVTSPQTRDTADTEDLFCDTAFITKRSRADGAPRWVRVVNGGAPTIEGCQSTSGDGVVVDSEGHIFLVGSYANTASFGSVTLQSARQDLFVAKYESDGTLIWARGLGPDSYAYARSVAVGADGSVAVLGWFRGTFVAPTGMLGDSAYDPAEMVVMLIEPNGEVRWARSFGGASPQAAVNCTGLARAPNGDVVIGCSAREAFSFGGPAIPVIGERGMIARFTPNGDLIWSTGVGDVAAQNAPPDLAILPSGAIVTLASEAPDYRTRDNMTLRGFDDNGGETWVRRAQSGQVLGLHDHGAIATAGDDRLLIPGAVRDVGVDVDFGLGPIPSNSHFLLAVASDGTPLDQVLLPSSAPRYLAPLPDGSIAFTGSVGPYPVVDIAVGVLDPPP
jgi:hypothetical protein